MTPEPQELEYTVKTKTVGQQQTTAILKIARILHDKEQEVEVLKHKVAELEQLLKSK